MNRCPITYELCSNKYSKDGLHLLSPKLKMLNDFSLTAQEQRALAVQQITKISIQGVQPKLSVKLNVAKEQFEVVDIGGTFILKPPHQMYEEVPQNEDLTMRLAKIVGLEVPLHGMIYNIDGSLTYFIKRFDKLPRGEKLAVEDFSQLMGFSRDTKYESSMEKLIPVIEKHCTFPLLEKVKLFRLTIFNFLVGNEDMHLKNFSLIQRDDKVELSPVYDLLNSSIIIKSNEELALPIKGKKSRLNRDDLIDYFGKERLGLSEKIMQEEMQNFQKADPLWKKLLNESFLSQKMRDKYLTLLQNRKTRLG